MLYLIKHLLIGSRGQVLKSYKRKIDGKISVTSFLVDPSHYVKYVASNLFAMLNNGKSNQCECKKSYDLLLNKYWGYIINND